MKHNKTEDEIRSCKKMTNIGGQALMEGLMMIGPENISMAVRKSDGTIHVETSPIGKASVATKIPFIRGSVKIFRQMVTGTGYLMKSAEFADSTSESSKIPDLKLDSGIINNSGESRSEAVPKNEITGFAEGPAEISTSDASAVKVDNISKSDVNSEVIHGDEVNHSDIPEYLVNSGEPRSEAISHNEDNSDGMNVNELDHQHIPGPNNNKQISNVETAVSGVQSIDTVPAKIKKAKVKKGPSKLEVFMDKHSSAMLYLSVLFGILLSVGLFILLPNLITSLTLNNWIDRNSSVGNRVINSLVEGVLRIAIFIVYLALASKMKEISRVWMYHGAEHKTIACYESKLPLTVDNVRAFSKHHPRCGTTFMFIVLLLSIILFSFVPRINIFVDLLIRLALVPLLAGLSYELIHFAVKHDNFMTRALSWPGLMLQRLTTKEPDDSMIEVAIAAMIPVIPAGERGDEW